MAKGRTKQLLENMDLPLIQTDNEEGSIPFFVIDDDYGIAVDNYGYQLCKRSKANKTVKNNDGIPIHIESYYKWTSFKYTNSLKSMFECYVKEKEYELHSKLTKSRDFRDLMEVQNEIKNIICTALKSEGCNKELLSIVGLLDEKEKLRSEIKELQNIKHSVIREADSLMNIIKEKRRIIIGETEPKKHRSKEEE